MLSVGDKAPRFALKDADGRTVKLGDFHGKKVVLYFYPRDMTPGCTKEACAFRDDRAQFAELNAVVIGVSGDSESSHQKFREKHDLNFTLLADAGNELAKQFGAWGEKNMYGRKSFGIIRSTFIIDEHGNIAKVFPKVKVDNHSKAVIAALKKDVG